MSQRTLPWLIAAVALLAAGCGNDNNGGPATVTSLVANEIAQNTRDDAAPILINDLPIAEDTRDDTEPFAVN